jgi:hypothetical protein
MLSNGNESHVLIVELLLLRLPGYYELSRLALLNKLAYVYTLAVGMQIEDGGNLRTSVVVQYARFCSCCGPTHFLESPYASVV